MIGFALLFPWAGPPAAIFAQEPSSPSRSVFDQIQERFPYLRFRGYLAYTLGLDTDWEPDEDHVQGWGAAFFEGRLDLTDRILAVASGRFDHYLWADGSTRTYYEANLYEAFLDVIIKKFEFRVGQQIDSWGKGDIFSPLDVLNPLDFRNLLDPTPDVLKIPVLMFKGTYDFGKWNLEGVYIPFFEPIQFDLFGTNASLFKHQFPQLHLGGLLGAFERLGLIQFPRLPSPDTLDPRFSRHLQDTLLATDYPPDDFLHGEYGLTLRATWKNVDVQVAYYYGWDDLPVYWINPDLAQALLSGEIDGATVAEMLRLIGNGDWRGIAHADFHRMQVVGAGFASTWRQFSFYAETAWYDERVFYDPQLRAFLSPALFSVAGGEYIYGSQLVVHLEFFDNSLLGPDRQPIGLDSNTFGGMFYCTGALLDQALRPELRLVYFINSKDLAVNPRVTYAFTDHFSATLGAIFYQTSGPVEIRTFLDIARATPFSLLSQNDWVYAKIQYAF